MTSAYRAALGGLVDELHPRLRAYFEAIPPGHVGRGAGVFASVGTRSPLLWLLLAGVEREGVAVGRFGRDIPFRVENRPGRGASVHARRTVLFTGYDWTMTDTIAAVGAGRTLVDDLGVTRRFRAAFRAEVRDGALLLTSIRFGMRLGRLRLTVPRLLSPVVTLEERFDDDRDRQHVDVRVRLPLLGTVYGYDGWFRYAVEREE